MTAGSYRGFSKGGCWPSYIAFVSDRATLSMLVERAARHFRTQYPRQDIQGTFSSHSGRITLSCATTFLESSGTPVDTCAGLAEWTWWHLVATLKLGRIRQDP